MIYLIDRRFLLEGALDILVNQVKRPGLYDKCFCLGCKVKGKVEVEVGDDSTNGNANGNFNGNVNDNVNCNVNCNDNCNVHGIVSGTVNVNDNGNDKVNGNGNGNVNDKDNVNVNGNVSGNDKVNVNGNGETWTKSRDKAWRSMDEVLWLDTDDTNDIDDDDDIVFIYLEKNSPGKSLSPLARGRLVLLEKSQGGTPFLQLRTPLMKKGAPPGGYTTTAPRVPHLIY